MELGTRWPVAQWHKEVVEMLGYNAARCDLVSHFRAECVDGMVPRELILLRTIFTARRGSHKSNSEVGDASNDEERDSDCDEEPAVYWRTLIIQRCNRLHFDSPAHHAPQPTSDSTVFRYTLDRIRHGSTTTERARLPIPSRSIWPTHSIRVLKHGRKFRNKSILYDNVYDKYRLVQSFEVPSRTTLDLLDVVAIAEADFATMREHSVYTHVCLQYAARMFQALECQSRLGWAPGQRQVETALVKGPAFSRQGMIGNVKFVDRDGKMVVGALPDRMVEDMQRGRKRSFGFLGFGRHEHEGLLSREEAEEFANAVSRDYRLEEEGSEDPIARHEDSGDGGSASASWASGQAGSSFGPK
ncbi:hypothetical protein DXG03_003930 [Asterophora parasitica]|uniref:Uncharacterized protein n=1 Tax=Asterophora parasitica TaxID=117018 RepID=A0A9P7KBM2_9AGAR|nr:hypothetical protein DXG03_003930 [Asterophora parasitica]